MRTTERWVRDIDAAHFYAPTVPPDAGPALRQAAREHRQALRPTGKETITNILMELRLSTQLRRQSADESEAQLLKLVDSLIEVPEDILRQAIAEFQKTEIFFPRAPAELLRFVNPKLAQRATRAKRLDQLAEIAEQAKADHDRLNAPPEPIPDHEVRSWTRSYAQTAVNMGFIPQSQFDRLFPTTPE